MSDAEDTLTRISRHPGVLAIMIVNLDGSFPRTMPSTQEHIDPAKYSALITPLAQMTRHCVRDLDPQNDLTFLRMRSKKHEILVAPDHESGQLVIVVQEPATFDH